MNTMTLGLIPIAMALQTVALAAAAAAPGPPGKAVRALNVTLEIPKKRFSAGESVPLKLTLANGGGQPVIVPFRSGQKFDFELLRDGKLIWNWANGRMFTQALAPMRLKPGESTSFTTQWDQRSNAGAPVPAGAYTVRAFVTTVGDRKPLTITQRIEIAR